MATHISMDTPYLCATRLLPQSCLTCATVVNRVGTSAPVMRHAYRDVHEHGVDVCMARMHGAQGCVRQDVLRALTKRACSENSEWSPTCAMTGTKTNAKTANICSQAEIMSTRDNERFFPMELRKSASSNPIWRTCLL